MDDPSFYGFPCYGEPTVKAAQDCGGPRRRPRRPHVRPRPGDAAAARRPHGARRCPGSGRAGAVAALPVHADPRPRLRARTGARATSASSSGSAPPTASSSRRRSAGCWPTSPSPGTTTTDLTPYRARPAGAHRPRLRRRTGWCDDGRQVERRDVDARARSRPAAATQLRSCARVSRCGARRSPPTGRRAAPTGGATAASGSAQVKAPVGDAVVDDLAEHGLPALVHPRAAPCGCAARAGPAPRRRSRAASPAPGRSGRRAAAPGAAARRGPRPLGGLARAGRGRVSTAYAKASATQVVLGAEVVEDQRRADAQRARPRRRPGCWRGRSGRAARPSPRGSRRGAPRRCDAPCAPCPPRREHRDRRGAAMTDVERPLEPAQLDAPCAERAGRGCCPAEAYTSTRGAGLGAAAPVRRRAGPASAGPRTCCRRPGRSRSPSAR